MWISKGPEEVQYLHVDTIIYTTLIISSLFLQNTRPVDKLDPGLREENNFLSLCKLSDDAPTEKGNGGLKVCELCAIIEAGHQYQQCKTMPRIISATRTGKLDVIIQELNNGVQVDTVDSEGQTALYLASCRGDVELTSFLINRGANVNHKVKWQTTPLHAASDRGKLNCVEILLNYGADVNAQNNNQDTPLHLAAFRGNYQICVLLLAHNADLNLTNFRGNIPYQEAKGEGHTKITKLLTPTTKGCTFPLEKNSSLHDICRAKYNYDVDSCANREFPTQHYQIPSFNLSLTSPIGMEGAYGFPGSRSIPNQQPDLPTFPSSASTISQSDKIYNDTPTVVPLRKTFSNGTSAPHPLPYDRDLLNNFNKCSNLQTQNPQIPHQTNDGAFHKMEDFEARRRKEESATYDLKREIFWLRQENKSLRKSDAERNLFVVDQEKIVTNLREELENKHVELERERSLKLSAEARSRQAIREEYRLRTKLAQTSSSNSDCYRTTSDFNRTASAPIEHSMEETNSISKSYDS